MQDVLETVFKDLDDWITKANTARREDGGFGFPKCEVRVLGQMSLLANKKVSAVLKLIGTLDLDAHLEKMDYSIKRKMIELLKRHNLTYDEDSEKIWLSPGSKFEELYKLSNLSVYILDPESALVSKAVKAKDKNRLLIGDAIASEKFPTLMDRIEANGGDLKFFLEKK